MKKEKSIYCDSVKFSLNQMQEMMEDLIEIIENLPYPPIKFLVDTDGNGDDVQPNVFKFIDSRWTAIKSLKYWINHINEVETYSRDLLILIIRDVKKYIQDKGIRLDVFENIKREED